MGDVVVVLPNYDVVEFPDADRVGLQLPIVEVDRVLHDVSLLY